MKVFSNLPEEVKEKYSSKSYDIVIGIPSYNNSETIRYVAEVAAKGVREYFPEAKAIILNSDGGSQDGTRDAFYSADTPGIDKLSFEYKGIPGKGSALRAIFEFISLVGGRYGVLLDSDLRSVKPSWIKNLVDPLQNGYSYVTPLYLRHKFDGTITNNIAYPMTTSLYGYKLRQPIGGDFAFTGQLARHWIEREDFDENTAKFGIDIWMTTTAINEYGKVAQASLGVKIHDEKDPGSSLGPMFFQVVGTLMNLMGTYKSKWSKVSSISEVPIFGEAPKEEPVPIKVNLQTLKEKFASGLESRRELYEKLLGRDLVSSLNPEEGIDLDRWIEILAIFSAEYQLRDKDARKELLDALVPLYFGRTRRALMELDPLNLDEAEARIESWAERFLERKEVFISTWRSRGLL